MNKNYLKHELVDHMIDLCDKNGWATTYRDDVAKYDRASIERAEPYKEFVWVPYDTGAHLMRLGKVESDSYGCSGSALVETMCSTDSPRAQPFHITIGQYRCTIRKITVSQAKDIASACA